MPHDVPELPEVETIRRHIERRLVGKRVVTTENLLPKLLRDSPIPDLHILEGKSLRSAGRRAKILVLTFDDDLSLLIHFKLAGQWAIVLPDGSRMVAGHPIPDPAGPYPHKVSHITFTFDDGTVAYFSDARQFGWLRLMPFLDVANVLAQFGFGPEGTGKLDYGEFRRLFAHRGVAVKSLLLDQTVIAGLGNIYVDEVLFKAKVHPGRAANRLAPNQVRAILASVGPVLAEGIAQGGAKIVYNRAQPVNRFPAVHGRADEPCFECGTTVRKIRVATRGTYYCPKCQKAPRIRKSKPVTIVTV